MVEFDLLRQQIEYLEKKIARLESSLAGESRRTQLYLMRLSDKDSCSSKSVAQRLPYDDLSPQIAYQKYLREDYNFFLLDVSSKSFFPPTNLEDAHKIELEQLMDNIQHLPSKSIPILVISEDGTRSLRACHLLHSCGFYNINNISGGHKFWPGHTITENYKKAA